ncbi:DUF2254 domain-containing protein [Peribacillus sp. SCS-37]|uniref:DUF2254 domain-containing protein n=1 Tax=Paraperibacillus esterisolvens TaxID=3115296 RepID=UPI0039068C94
MLRKKAEAKIKTNFWVMPALYGAGAFVLAVLSVLLEQVLSDYEGVKGMIPSFLFVDKELAQTILSAISTSLLTMTTITFSSVLVVLTTFLAQFSPRTLQNFINDSKTQLVLGTFIGGYVYSLLLLSQIKGREVENTFILPALAIVVAFICLAMFVFLIHHVTDWIKVGNVVSSITTETLDSIKKHNQEQHPGREAAKEAQELKAEEAFGIKSSKRGYIEYADIEAMVRMASEQDIVVRFEKSLGNYVDVDTPLLKVWNSRENFDESRLLNLMMISSRQEVIQGVEFGIQKLVEVALRGIAPGKNDPETAINCIEHLSQILIKIGKNYEPNPYYCDSEGKVRVIIEKPQFADFLYDSFYQIRHYGKADVSVMASILEALTLVAETNVENIKESVWDFSGYIVEGIQQQEWLQLDKRHLNQKLSRMAAACGRPAGEIAI